MSEKIVITKPGFNAGTETNPLNLIFSSDYASLKYYTSGSINVSYSGTVGEGTVNHGLGYVPFFVGYVGPLVGVGTGDAYCMCPFNQADMSDFIYASTWADSNNLYFRVEKTVGVANGTLTFPYKIFRNNLGL